MNSLFDKWANNEAIAPPGFIRLARTVGLKAVNNTRRAAYSENSLEALLKSSGPLWCAGYWYSPGHVVVVTGVDDRRIYINDPDRGVAKSGDFQWFNRSLAATFPGCIMAKDPVRY